MKPQRTTGLPCLTRAKTGVDDIAGQFQVGTCMVPFIPVLHGTHNPCMDYTLSSAASVEFLCRWNLHLGNVLVGPPVSWQGPPWMNQSTTCLFFSFLFFWAEGKILIKTKATGLHMSLIVSNDKRSSQHSKKGSLILDWNRIYDGGPHLMDGLDHEPFGHHLSTTSWIPTPTLTSQSYVAHGLLWTCAKAASESWRKACK